MKLDLGEPVDFTGGRLRVSLLGSLLGGSLLGGSPLGGILWVSLLGSLLGSLCGSLWDSLRDSLKEDRRCS